MTTRLNTQALLTAALLASAVPGSLLVSPARAGDEAWQKVSAILQSPDNFSAGYHRFNLPRKDITLKLGEVTVAPELALGAWVGFSGDPGDATMMGDLVLRADELKPVFRELAKQGIDVTAIHNHLAGEQPPLTYVHFHAMGPAEEMAKRLDPVIALTSTPRPVAPATPLPLAIDTATVFSGLGRTGKARGSVAQASFTLVPGAVTLHGHPLVPALAYGSPINIQSLGPDRAVATGDFALTGPQVQPLLQALATHGITGTALHTHMIGESPTLYFVHFWADSTLPEVVKGLRAALDAVR